MGFFFNHMGFVITDQSRVDPWRRGEHLSRTINQVRKGDATETVNLMVKWWNEMSRTDPFD